MSRHIAPHRWGDAFAGRVSEAERATMEAHAKMCASCKRVRDRVGRASDSFTAIKTQSPPEIGWDSVRARVHWSVSKERREKTGPYAKGTGAHDFDPPNHWRFAWAAGAIAAVTALGLATNPPDRPTRDMAMTEPKTTPNKTTVPTPVQPEKLAGLVVRARGAVGEVMVDGVRPVDLFAQRLGPGSVLATGEGRVDVQFGDASSFALAPRSTLELRQFDAKMIELRIDGTVDIEVAARASDQRFVVIAGEHSIEVRGTQFRVSRTATSTTVACRHGLVAVRDRSTQVEVGTAKQIAIAAGQSVSADRIVPIQFDDLRELAEAMPMRVPLWSSVDALLGTSAPLEIATVGARDVRVDGIELGTAPLRVRVMPGRHTVEVGDQAGRYRRAGWVDVAAPSPDSRPARLEVPADPPPTGGIKERRRQLLAGIDRARLSRCTRSIAKSGLTDTYVQVELSVDANGAVGFLNVIDTDLPSSTAGCVREVMVEVRFGKGAAATWRERIAL